MKDCKPIATPFDTNSKLSIHVGEPVADPSLYGSLVGTLQYLTFTRPDISYVVQQIWIFIHSPKVPHFNALKHIICYLQGAAHHILPYTHYLQYNVFPTLMLTAAIFLTPEVPRLATVYS